MAKTGEPIDYKALNYTELIPIIVKAIQEQQQTIQSQQKAIQTQQQQIDDLKRLVQNLAVGKNISSSSFKSIPPDSSSISLKQNIPNPYSNTTTIAYSLGQKFTNAQIVITDKEGKTLKAVTIAGSGKGNINVDASTLSSDAYQYSL